MSGLSSRLRGWRPLLRMAAREALRARGRSALTLVMIALPVLAVTAALFVTETAEVRGAEALERRIGTADAEVRFLDAARAQQTPDPFEVSGWGGRPPKGGRAHDLAAISEALGREVTGIERREGNVRARTDEGVLEFEGVELDLRSPLAEGLFRLVDGDLPASTDQVVVTPALATRGPGIGEVLEVEDGSPLLVVGVVEHPEYRDHPYAVSPPGGFGFQPDAYVDDQLAEWLVDAGGPVSWDDVLRLNEVGALVVSRAVLEDPPPESAIPADVQGTHPVDDTMLAVIALVVVMALIEVVLLAGPAFAVGARRQQRNLALLASTGGTPAQMRRVILASAVVLGSVAAGLGVVLGVVLGWSALPVVQQFSGSWFGPVDVPWLPVLGVAVFGLVSAVLAAAVPAWLAARQDVVAVLAGRRGDRRPRLRSPLLGLALFGAGVAGAVVGARDSDMGELWIAVAAVLCVLGMVLLVPVVLVGVSALARFLPLSLRYAVRDAARHRTRTVPAVAAVAATVVGVVALGIGAASDELQNRAEYQPMLAMGDGVVEAYRVAPEARHDVWRDLTAAVAVHTDGATPVVGIPSEPAPDAFVDLVVRGPGGEEIYGSWASTYGAAALVSDGMPEIPLSGVSDQQLAQADRVLRQGGAVVFGEAIHADAEGLRAMRDLDHVLLRLVTHGADKVQRSPRVEVPAMVIMTRGTAPAHAVIAPTVADALGTEPAQTALLVNGPVDRPLEQDIEEAVGAVQADVGVYVERGYESDDEALIVMLVLAGLGAVLMIGGTLTATFLALSDARPDLATLSAVGASPRTRRAVAASYALVVGGVGAVLGAAVGMVPGIAVTWPLTRGWDPGVSTHYLDIPWLLIVGIVVLLPVFTAVVVGLCARSRLPMVSRLA